MRYSIRSLLLIVFLCAFTLVTLKSTAEIWVDWYNGLTDWFRGAKTHICLLFCILSLGFIAGWLSRTWVPGISTRLVSLVAYGVFNVVMYSLTRTAIHWVDYAGIDLELHITGAMNMLIVAVDSGLLLMFTCCFWLLSL